VKPEELHSEILYIKNIIEDRRRSLVENGIGYIIWGVIIVIGLIFQYLSLIKAVSINTNYTWAAVIGLGWIVTNFLVRKERKLIRSKYYGSHVLRATWISASVVMTTIGFIGPVTGTLPGFSIIPLMCSVLAIAFSVSGMIYKEKLMIASGVIWWITSVIFFLWHSVHSLMIFACLMILLQVMPGVYFYKKWRLEFSRETA